MGSNISGNASGWVEHKEINNVSTKRSTEQIDYNNVLKELKELHIELKERYNFRPNKNVYDSIISLDTSIQALLLN